MPDVIHKLTNFASYNRWLMLTVLVAAVAIGMASCTVTEPSPTTGVREPLPVLEAERAVVKEKAERDSKAITDAAMAEVKRMLETAVRDKALLEKRIAELEKQNTVESRAAALALAEQAERDASRLAAQAEQTAAAAEKKAADLLAEAKVALTRYDAAIDRIQAKQEVTRGVLDTAASIAGTVVPATGPWGQGLAALFALITLGVARDNRRKDAKITELKTALTTPSSGSNGTT